jgi:prepilin-type processing-associated H-X9-DG protein
MYLVVVADACVYGTFFRGATDILYGCCDTGCGNSSYYDSACSASQICSFPPEDLSKFQTDSTFREKFTRHLGGSNVGFADGHAQWYKADALTAVSPYTDANCNPVDYQPDGQPLLEGLCPNVMYR